MATASSIMSDAIANNWTKDDILVQAADYVGTGDWQQYILAAQNIDYVLSNEAMPTWSDEHWNTWFADTGMDKTGYDWLGHYQTIMEEGGLTAYQTVTDMTSIMNAIDVRLNPENYAAGGSFDIGDVTGEAWSDVTDIGDKLLAEGIEQFAGAGIVVDIGGELLEEGLESVGLDEWATAVDELGDDYDDIFDELTEGIIEDVLTMDVIGGAENIYENIGEAADQFNEMIEDFSENILNIISPELPEGEAGAFPAIDLSNIEVEQPPARYGRRETIYSALPGAFEEKEFTTDLPEATKTPINEIIGNSLI